MIVGTSTSCSASCGSRTGVRAESSSMRILGTSITCSGTWISCDAKASTNSCSSISGTGTSSIGAEMICSTVCRWSRSCGLTSVSRSGREPLAAGASSRSRKKCCAPAAWGRELLRIVAVKFNSYSPRGPCRLLSPWSCVMVILGKCHCDAQTLMPKPLSESSLPPPRGSRLVGSSSCRQHEGTKQVTQTRARLRNMP